MSVTSEQEVWVESSICTATKDMLKCPKVVPYPKRNQEHPQSKFISHTKNHELSCQFRGHRKAFGKKNEGVLST